MVTIPCKKCGHPNNCASPDYEYTLYSTIEPSDGQNFIQQEYICQTTKSHISKHKFTVYWIKPVISHAGGPIKLKPDPLDGY